MIQQAKRDRSSVLLARSDLAIGRIIGGEEKLTSELSAGGGAFPSEDGRMAEKLALSGSMRAHRGGGSGAARGNIG